MSAVVPARIMTAKRTSPMKPDGIKSLGENYQTGLFASVHLPASIWTIQLRKVGMTPLNEMNVNR
jgi:hypothetical protein